MSRPLKGHIALLVAVLTMLACETAAAQDDGARSYWKAMDGTNIVGFQYLPFNVVTLASDAVDPVHYIYPEADVEGSLFILNYTRHLTVFGRAASLSGLVMGGTLDVEYFGGTPGAELRQSSHGFGDPSVQFTVNLFGAPTLPSFYHLAKYEPKVVLDVAILGAIPIGDYDENQFVNIGLNRWWGRIALPFTYHIGPYVPGYRSSIEIVPSVSLFAPNSDFVGVELENEPLYQVEAHVTHDFTSHFFASADLLYRHGALSTTDGVEAEDPLDALGVGFTLDFQLSDNSGMRYSYQSLIAGESDLDGDLLRVMGYFGWHALVENVRKLSGG
jgi:hypothetical protein